MFDFLNNHPFAVEANFEHSIVLTFAVPKEQLQGLLPECLELDTFKDTLAFIAVAMVQTRALRPRGFPKFLGHDFFLIGYRIFVRYRSESGKRLRGLFILKSETDKRKMEILGNIFTKYSYTTTDIKQERKGEIVSISSLKSKFRVSVRKAETQISLPDHSPFKTWTEARRFAGPLPFTFTFDTITNKVLIIEGVRQNWTPQPLMVLDYDFEFLRLLHLNQATLANAFIIENIPYHWKRGKFEQWKK